MKWCQSCVLPDTRPNIVVGPDGICNACQAHRVKKERDWTQLAADFEDVVRWAKNRSSGYDCIIPVSGGKDSTWQVYKCLQYGLNPLAVTWKTPGRTVIGQRNLDNLISLGVDHIDYQVSPKVEAAFMVKTFEKYGSTGIPMHLALFNIPMMLAVKFNIPLVVWGENSAFEYGTKDERLTGFQLDKEWLKHFGVAHGTTADDWVDADLSRQMLTPYFGPDPDTLEAQGVRAIFLGYYFEWDPEETYRVARENGFSANANGARTGLYDFADIDDDFISLHHWMKWYKFGFTRTFDNLSLEIRNGRMTRSEALDALMQIGDETPQGDIEKFCSFSGLSSEQFFNTAEKFRNLDIWHQGSNGRWEIKDFLFEKWNWT